ncbi:MAG: hypothetical protein Q9202_006926 [Teloschistes flavicans]
MPDATALTFHILLVYVEMSSRPANNLRPLHVDIHGGGFIGGIPEYDAPFCTQVAKTTGAVVVSVAYRFAPRHPYPAAHDDVEDAILWLVKNSEREFGADPQLLTVSGSSAGGNLALGASLNIKKREGKGLVKGIVTFYTPVDLRIPPQDKRKPPGFPSIDLSWPLFPLFDAYAGMGRILNNEDPRLHPTLIPSQDWPADTLFIIPMLDILRYEQLELVERLQNDHAECGESTDAKPPAKRIEKLLFEGQWHGWLDLPTWAIDESTRREAFTAACDFLMDTHRKYLFDARQKSVVA